MRVVDSAPPPSPAGTTSCVLVWPAGARTGGAEGDDGGADDAEGDGEAEGDGTTVL